MNEAPDTTPKAASGKKPYEKPTIAKVPLRPEEAVLGFCKTSTSFGPLQGSCLSPTACSSPGS